MAFLLLGAVLREVTPSIYSSLSATAGVACAAQVSLTRRQSTFVTSEPNNKRRQQGEFPLKCSRERSLPLTKHHIPFPTETNPESSRSKLNSEVTPAREQKSWRWLMLFIFSFMWKSKCTCDLLPVPAKSQPPPFPQDRALPRLESQRRGVGDLWCCRSWQASARALSLPSHCYLSADNSGIC